MVRCPAIFRFALAAILVALGQRSTLANHPDQKPEPVIASVADVPNDNGGYVRVTWWHSQWDWHPYHNVRTYRLLRHTPGSNPYWQEVGVDNAQAVQTYSLVSPAPTGQYTTFMVRAVDLAGTVFWDSAPDSGLATNNLTGVGEPPGVQLALGAAYPNPMQHATSIRVSLAVDSRITLTVFDARGRLVKELVDREMRAGGYEFGWDGRTSEGIEAAPGAYFYRLTAAERILSGRVFLVR